jgi:hypothetical protein
MANIFLNKLLWQAKIKNGAFPFQLTILPTWHLLLVGFMERKV